MYDNTHQFLFSFTEIILRQKWGGRGTIHSAQNQCLTLLKNRLFSYWKIVLQIIAHFQRSRGNSLHLFHPHVLPKKVHKANLWIAPFWMVNTVLKMEKQNLVHVRDEWLDWTIWIYHFSNTFDLQIWQFCMVQPTSYNKSLYFYTCP